MLFENKENYIYKSNLNITKKSLNYYKRFLKLKKNRFYKFIVS